MKHTKFLFIFFCMITQVIQPMDMDFFESIDWQSLGSIDWQFDEHLDNKVDINQITTSFKPSHKRKRVDHAMTKVQRNEKKAYYYHQIQNFLAIQLGDKAQTMSDHSKQIQRKKRYIQSYLKERDDIKKSTDQYFQKYQDEIKQKR